MTSCILYGLTLARLLQGSVFAAKSAKADDRIDIHEVAVSYAVLALIPILGVIVSVLVIGQAVMAPSGWSIVAIQLINLVFAIGVFFVLGGHGIKHSESGGMTDDTVE